MKKLLFLLVFIPLVSFGQDDDSPTFFNYSEYGVSSKFKNFEEQWLFNLMDLEETIIKMNYANGVDLDVILTMPGVTWKRVGLNTPEKVKNLIKKDSLKYFNFRSKYKRDFEKYTKLKIGSNQIIVLNLKPWRIKKNYFELFWKRTIESFGYVDVFDFREKYGHSYRDIMDYSYTYICNVDRRYPNSFSPYYDYDKFLRTPEENFIEFSARLAPLISYIFLIYLFLRIKIVRKTTSFLFKKQTIKNIFNIFLTISVIIIHITEKKLNLFYNLRLFANNYTADEAIYESRTWNSCFNINDLVHIESDWRLIIIIYLILMFIIYILSVIIAFIFFPKKLN